MLFDVFRYLVQTDTFWYILGVIKALDLDAPLGILFEDSHKKVEPRKKNSIGGGYRGYYWRWFEPFKEYYTQPARENLQLPTPSDFELAFRITTALERDKYLKDVDTVDDFFGVMELIIDAVR